MVQNKRGLRLNKLKTYTLVKIQQAISLAKKLYRQQHRAAIVTFIVVLAISGGLVWKVQAETYPGGTDNGLTSRIKELSDSLAALGHGTTTANPDWGAMWNRIKTAATWTPPGDVAAGDIRMGKKYYNGSRTEQIGTAPIPSACPNQLADDANSLIANSCTEHIIWTVPSPSVEGDEKRDPVTGLVWSQYLDSNTTGVLTFTKTYSQAISFSYLDNPSFGNRTAAQMCAEVAAGGGIWRLPTQKELMQAYIDGSYYNLLTTNANNGISSSTLASSSARYTMRLDTGDVGVSHVNNSAYMRCVREG